MELFGGEGWQKPLLSKFLSLFKTKTDPKIAYFLGVWGYLEEKVGRKHSCLCSALCSKIKTDPKIASFLGVWGFFRGGWPKTQLSLFCSLFKNQDRP